MAARRHKEPQDDKAKNALVVVKEAVDDGVHDLTLEDLAKRINELHKDIIGLFRRSGEHAIMIGNLLLEAKAKVEHGRWENWVLINTKLSVRTAQNYMKIAMHGHYQPDALGMMAALTITDNLKATASPQKRKKGQGKPKKKSAGANILKKAQDILDPKDDDDDGDEPPEEYWIKHAASLFEEYRNKTGSREDWENWLTKARDAGQNAEAIAVIEFFADGGSPLPIRERLELRRRGGDNYLTPTTRLLNVLEWLDENMRKGNQE